MQKKSFLIGCALMVAGMSQPEAQNAGRDSTYRKCFAGSTFLMPGNYIPNDRNPPPVTQLNAGYRTTRGQVAFLELKRSRFACPLGVPWGKSFDAPGEHYPGHVRQNGIGLTCNCFGWKGLFAGIHALNAFQKYYDGHGEKIAGGYTLFVTYRPGYQARLLKNRFFTEPAVGLTHWPVTTNTPAFFEAGDSLWPAYAGLEPGLHFGFNC